MTRCGSIATWPSDAVPACHSKALHANMNFVILERGFPIALRQDDYHCGIRAIRDAKSIAPQEKHSRVPQIRASGAKFQQLQKKALASAQSLPGPERFRRGPFASIDVRQQ